MGWERGCDVARRRACVTPASRGRLGVIATGLENLPRESGLRARKRRPVVATLRCRLGPSETLLSPLDP